MNKSPIQRHVKRVDASGQFALPISSGTDKPDSPAAVKGLATFVDPDPHRLQVAGVLFNGMRIG